MVRLLILTLGPPLLVAAAYAVAHPKICRSEVTAPGDSAQVSAAKTAATSSGQSGSRGSAGHSLNGPPSDVVMLAGCQRKREAYMKRLGPRFSSIVHRPFIIIGDASAQELEREYRETIAAVDRILRIEYFDTPPFEPITIILLSSDDAYQSCAKRLDGGTREAFAGYYERGERRIVINAATGEGTIAHELTHALAQFDFPEMPEWFDEGLASLHEEGRFSEDRRHITGVPNWRGQFLARALQNSTLRSVESLISQKRLRQDQQAVDYAHVRYLCLFLQDRGLLAPFYRKFRAAAETDPTGLRTLCGLFGVDEPGPIDREFRTWATALIRQPRDP
jgi:hypothetical protein